jgi:hypothetical protein
MQQNTILSGTGPTVETTKHDHLYEVAQGLLNNQSRSYWFGFVFAFHPRLRHSEAAGP